MKNDNKGFSLVELIIVIAIIGILGTMFISGTGYISSSAARSLSNSVKTAIGETRIKTMGKQETALYLYKDAADGKYYKQYIVKVNNTWQTPEPAEVIGKHHPTVIYTEDKSDPTKDTALDSTGVYICFDRKTGKEAVVDVNGTDSKLVEEIRISGGGATCIVSIVPSTGKVTLE